MARDMAQMEAVHSRRCKHPEARCNCEPSYRVNVWDPRMRTPHRKTLPSYPEAKTWRDDVRAAIRAGTIRKPSTQTVLEAAELLLEGMRDGSWLSRSGREYKPSTCRSYEQAVRTYLVPDPLAGMRVSEVRRADIQDYVMRLRKTGLGPSTLTNKVDPLRVIFRRAMHRDEISIDPTEGLEMPAIRGHRERVASREEAAALIAALPHDERAFWATAFYAGLRRGELRALRWSDVDLGARPALIHVRRTWDDKEGEVEVKTDAGFRTVPVTIGLFDLLFAHQIATGRAGEDLVFGRTRADPFVNSTVRSRAMRVWGWKEQPNPEPEGPRMIWVKARPDALEPIAPHEGRHSAASYLIEAGLNDLELTATIGHSDSRTTMRIYGHLFPDSSASIAKKLDAYHAACITDARFSDRASDRAPQNDENPGSPGHS